MLILERSTYEDRSTEKSEAVRRTASRGVRNQENACGVNKRAALSRSFAVLSADVRYRAGEQYGVLQKFVLGDELVVAVHVIVGVATLYAERNATFHRVDVSPAADGNAVTRLALDLAVDLQQLLHEFAVLRNAVRLLLNVLPVV